MKRRDLLQLLGIGAVAVPLPAAPNNAPVEAPALDAQALLSDLGVSFERQVFQRTSHLVGIMHPPPNSAFEHHVHSVCLLRQLPPDVPRDILIAPCAIALAERLCRDVGGGSALVFADLPLPLAGLTPGCAHWCTFNGLRFRAVISFDACTGNLQLAIDTMYSSV